MAIASRSWQGGCLGTPATETRTGATGTRVDDVHDWVQQTRARAWDWKTQALVPADADLYLATRLYDGTWTPYQDVQAAAGNIGGVRAVSSVGIDGDTHVLALGGDGHLHYAVHNLDGGWGQKFVDLDTTVADLGTVTQLSIANVGGDLHIVVVANGRLLHSRRPANGQWSVFGVVTDETGPLNGITSLAAAGVRGGELHIAAVSGGKVYHARRFASGVWSSWGWVAGAAGATPPVTGVAVTPQGTDLNLAIVTSGGQYHTVRYADGNWQPFRLLADATGTSVSAAPVDTDARFAVTTTENRIVLTARHGDGTWSAPEYLDLTAVPGNHTGTAINASL
ncbi:hypothetical protein [Kitasatospora sp. NPDC001547]|uniref:hypothetical protein n=1 Tax=Kitasatospora sp. NPDC001547 TaxID=3364015 RepID=UPI0036AEFE30